MGYNGNIWNELTQAAEKESGYEVMIGNSVSLIGGGNSHPTTTPAATLYVPLQFWFCKNPGLDMC
jgi:hypothetical protein